MRRHLLLALSASFFSAACVTPPAEQKLAQVDQADLICTREAPTGSKIPVRRCRTAADIEAQRRSDKEIADNLPTEKHDVLVGK